MEYLKKLFGAGEDTIESIVSDVQSKIARLRAVAKKHYQDALDKQEQARQLVEESDVHTADSARADKIADKFSHLLED